MDYRGVDDSLPETWKRIQDYDNLYPYMRDIYQLDNVADTVNLEHIVEHYASPGSPQLDTHDVDDVELQLEEPHNRDRFGSEPLAREH